MIILGLTGSIGMGKTTASKHFCRLGIPVYNADHAVHEMMSDRGEAVSEIKKIFPAAFQKGQINRQILAQEVFSNNKALIELEKILHPLVRLRENFFLSHCARLRKKIVVLDVPLLFETGGNKRCDGIITVSAPAFVQRQRVINRHGMTPKRFQAILNRQLSDTEKQKQSDFVVLTGIGHRFTLLQIINIVKITKQWKGRHWP